MMETVKSLLCCFIPGLRRRCAEERERKSRTQRRRDLLTQMWQMRTSRNYRQRRGKIIDTIPFDYFRTVIVWTQAQDAEVARDEIVGQLQICGTVASLQDRWSVDERGRKKWRGALVQYSKAKEAQKAAVDLPLQFQHVQFTLLQTVIDTLVDCELFQPDNRGETSKVVISRNIPLRLEEVDDLRRKLGTYGPIQTFYVNNRQTTLGSFCEVTYSHLTQAYLAATMTNGHLYNSRGILRSFVDRSAKDAGILEDAKDCIVLLSHSCFPY